MTSFLPLSSERGVEQAPRVGSRLRDLDGALVGPEHQTDIIDNLVGGAEGRGRRRPVLTVLFLGRRREVDRDLAHVSAIGEPLGLAQARGEDRRREAVA